MKTLDQLRRITRAVSTTFAARVEQLRREPEAGYTTETVVVTALLVVLALIVLGVITAAVIAKAHSITL